MGVKIEIFKMMVYLSFPVAMFWVSNQAEYFEEYVVKRKREMFPPSKEFRKIDLKEYRRLMEARLGQHITEANLRDSEN